MSKNPVDRRSVLEEEVFTHRVTKDGKVFIAWHGKQVTILSGKKAEAFIAAMVGADAKAAQLLMAKATGNFKHGNEKMNKKGS